MKAAIEGLALEKPPLPISSVHRQICQFARQVEEIPPSYATVLSVTRALPKDLRTLAHHGSRVYSEIYDLVHRREAARANAVWQVDHAQLPIRLASEDGKSARPWLTVVIDDYSRAIAGYYLGSDFTSKRLEQVAAALRIKAIFSTPGEPRGRGRVERLFRTVNEMFLSDLSGYTRRDVRRRSTPWRNSISFSGRF